MAFPKFLQFTSGPDGKTFDLSAATASEIIDASQTSNSTIRLGSGTTFLFAGDGDTVYAGKGTDFIYSARGTTLSTGSGSDTFVYGVGSKPQAPGMIGACTVNDRGNNSETIEISKSFFGSTAAQQSANLAAAIANANASPLQPDGSRLLTIDSGVDKAGHSFADSIKFTSGAALDASHFKLV